MTTATIRRALTVFRHRQAGRRWYGRSEGAERPVDRSAAQLISDARGWLQWRFGNEIGHGELMSDFTGEWIDRWALADARYPMQVARLYLEMELDRLHRLIADSENHTPKQREAARSATMRQVWADVRREAVAHVNEVNRNRQAALCYDLVTRCRESAGVA